MENHEYWKNISSFTKEMSSSSLQYEYIVIHISTFVDKEIRGKYKSKLKASKGRRKGLKKLPNLNRKLNKQET